MPQIDFTAKPDPEDVTRYHAYLEKLWSATLEDMKTAYDVYFQETDIWANLARANSSEAAERPQFHSGKVPGMIDHAVDSHLAFEPQFHYIPAGQGEEDKEKAGHVEKGLQAVFHDAHIAQPYFPTKVNGKQLSICNYTQLYVGLDLDALGAVDKKTGEVRRPERNQGEDLEDFQRRDWEWETSRHTWNPVRLETPQLGEVLMDPREKSPRVALRRHTYLAHELEGLTQTKMAKRFADEVFQHTGDPYDEIEVLEWWSPYWVHVQRKDGGILWVEPNAWGFQPFIQTWGGATDMPAGRQWDPKWYVRQSLIWAIRGDANFRDQAIVSQQNILMRKAWAKMGTPRDAAEMAEMLRQGILQGTKDDLWVEPTPDVPNQIFTQEAVLDKDMEEATFTLQSAGFHQPGIDTATGMMIATGRADRKFHHVVQQMQHLYSIAGSNILKLVTRMEKAYGVGLIKMGEHTLKASDVQGHFHVTADFGQVDPVTLMQLKQDARIDLERGLLHEDGYHLIARHEDPAGIKKGVLKDMIRKMPEVIEELVQIALREEGFGKLADRRKAEQRIAALGIVGPNGQPIQSGGGGMQPAAPAGMPPSNGRMGA